MKKFLITYNFNNEKFKKEIFATSESEAVFKIILAKKGAIILSIKEITNEFSLFF